METFKLSDNVISRIAQIVQEGMLLGVDVVDLLRQVELEKGTAVDNSTELELSSVYKAFVAKMHQDLVTSAEAIQASRSALKFVNTSGLNMSTWDMIIICTVFIFISIFSEKDVKPK